MDSSTVAAWAAAVVATISAALSTWQAALSKRQATSASRAANAAEITAVDTQRAADIAARELAHAEIDRSKTAWLAELQALRNIEHSMRNHANALLELANHLDSHSENSPCERFKEINAKLNEAGELMSRTPIAFLDNACGPANVEFVRLVNKGVEDLLRAMATSETEDPIQFARVVRITGSGMTGIARILSNRLCRMAGEKLGAELEARQAINCRYDTRPV